MAGMYDFNMGLIIVGLILIIYAIYTMDIMYTYAGSTLLTIGCVLILTDDSKEDVREYSKKDNRVANISTDGQTVEEFMSNS